MSSFQSRNSRTQPPSLTTTFNNNNNNNSSSIDSTIHPLLISPIKTTPTIHPSSSSTSSTSQPSTSNDPNLHLHQTRDDSYLPSISSSSSSPSTTIPSSTHSLQHPQQTHSPHPSPTTTPTPGNNTTPIRNYLPTTYPIRSSSSSSSLFKPPSSSSAHPHPHHPSIYRPQTSIDTVSCLVSTHHPSISPSSQPNPPTTIATEALLFQNLRGEAQALGLESHSLGWAIIQSIYDRQPIARGLPSTSNLIETLSSTHHPLECCLLLPKSKSPQEILNLESILNHILITTPALEPVPPSHKYLVNLNGWKGLIEGDRILFTSPGPPIDPHQIHGFDPRLILSNINPPTSLSNELTSPAQLRFPIYHLLSPPSKTITIPRFNPNHPTRGSTAQRLASLFVSKSESEPLTINIRVIDRGLDSFELDQSITQAVTNRITDGLGSLEENMLNIIRRFITRFSVSERPSSIISDLQLPAKGSSLHLASNEEKGEAIQMMYQDIDHELEKEYHEEINSPESADETKLIIDHTLELIEEVVCIELYDRLFEDCLEDQELSEKIAQLNLIDISLDHLGLDLERREMDDPDGIMTIRTGLDHTINAASAELSRLQDAECRSPRDKVGVYVTVHKLIVDRLSSLPPIPMKKEGIPAGVVTGKLSLDEERSNEVEMSDTLDRTGLPKDTAHMDRTLPMSSPFRPIEKDCPSASDLMDAIHTNLIDPPALPSSTDSGDVPSRSPNRQKVNPPRPNSSSADLILPILIYLIIKSNPNKLKSNLNYVNRFRYQRLVTGETDYCLVNFNVSCEFIKNFTGFDGCETIQSSSSNQTLRHEASGETFSSDPRKSGKVGYGTFPSPNKHSREKTGNSEVEEAFMAASRVVGGVLLGGYQKVISSSLLDTSVAKFGLAGGTRSAPRTLEDVKKLIGSGSGGSRREGNMSSWSHRVGLLRRNSNVDKRDSSHSNPNAIENGGSGSSSGGNANGSNAVMRLSSLFQNNTGPSNPIVSGHHTFASQNDEDRVTIGQRLSSLPGLGRLSHQSIRNNENLHIDECLVAGVKGLNMNNDNLNGGGGISDVGGGLEREDEERKIKHKGPIERFEGCDTSDQLLVSDIPVLLADYKRLGKIGRSAGIW